MSRAYECVYACGGCGRRFTATLYVAEVPWVSVAVACSQECWPEAQAKIPQEIERFRKWAEGEE